MREREIKVNNEQCPLQRRVAKDLEDVSGASLLCRLRYLEAGSTAVLQNWRPEGWRNILECWAVSTNGKISIYENNEFLMLQEIETQDIYEPWNLTLCISQRSCLFHLGQWFWFKYSRAHSNVPLCFCHEPSLKLSLACSLGLSKVRV